MNIAILTDIKQHYEFTDQSTIKRNIKRLMTLHGVSHHDMVLTLGIKLNTARSYTNPSNNNKPELYTLMILAAKFEVNVDEFFKS
jgi:transcriptional regulator with XRE-family HTH domain